MKITSKTPKGAVNELCRYLHSKGYGSFISKSDGGGMTVASEEAPYGWSLSLSGGSSLYAGELGCWSTPGDYPEGLSNSHVCGEPQNHYAITFYKN